MNKFVSGNIISVVAYPGAERRENRHRSIRYPTASSSTFPSHNIENHRVPVFEIRDNDQSINPNNDQDIGKYICYVADTNTVE